MTRVLLTGANGHLGRRLLARLRDDVEVTAVVRSERARQHVERAAHGRAGLTVHVIDPADARALAPLAARADVAVHFIGTIRETRDNRYADAHQRPAAALLEALQNSPVRHVLYLGILGSDARSACACLRARAAVEALLARAPRATTVIRIPMVLGERDRASAALARRAAAARTWLWRGESLEQPVYAGDVIDAVQGLIDGDGHGHRVFDLAGPESLSRRALVMRAARQAGLQPRVYSLPLAFGLALAGVLECLSNRPAVTRDMLRVLDHDDAIDAGAAARALGIALTPLESMLERCVLPRLRQANGR